MNEESADQREGDPDENERRFEAALERVRRGVPTAPELVRRAQLGRLGVNCLSVATEAGLPYAMINRDGCRYPGVRSRILAIKPAKREAPTQREIIDELRATVADLQQKLRVRDSRAALLTLRHQTELRAAVAEIARMTRRAARDVGTPERLGDEAETTGASR